jgi:hypothetical protein
MACAHFEVIVCVALPLFDLSLIDSGHRRSLMKIF